MKKEGGFDTFWCSLKDILTVVPSTSTVFNQYRDRNEELDVPDAPAVRIDNLRRYMAEASSTAKTLVVGEAAGPLGCRFSGVPFTSERQLLDLSFPVQGRRSSKEVPSRTTKVAPPFFSQSSEVFWEIMRPYHGQFLVWNAFPLHSYEEYDVLTVRNPTKGEVSQFREALRLIKAFIEPIHIVAVGRKALEELNALGECEPSITYVRHPSRGGKTKFTAGMRKVFKGDKRRR
jgi:hypothetical protein